jgi:hypothetical protein
VASGSFGTYQEKKCELSFSTSVKYGKQDHQLVVLISTDFDGNYKIESIKKATWKSLNQVAEMASGEEFENSGAIDVTQLLKKDKPFYIAFKYIGEASNNGKPTQRTWQVKDIKLSGKGITNFNIVNNPVNGEKVGWSKTSQGFIYRPSATLIASEGWMVSNKLNN